VRVVCPIEGVSKSLKRYSKLMLRRIDWNEGREEEEEEAAEQGREPKEPNQCVLVWQGSVVEPAFRRWRFESCRTVEAAKKLLVDAGVGHYWDTVANAGWEGISELQ
jgi:U4/U6 small nuclear ribonucleoprotein PRP3